MTNLSPTDLREAQYNAQDVIYTHEIQQAILSHKNKMGMDAHYSFQQSLILPVLRMMNRGVRFDLSRRETLRKELLTLAQKKENDLFYILSQPINIGSKRQMQDLFYNQFNLPVQLRPKTNNPTLNATALLDLKTKEPLIAPVVNLILELRSLGVFLSTFIGASLDIDGRVRCSFNVAGTGTYRFSSSKNAFGSGLNMQNLPKDPKNKSGDSDWVDLPNIRELFLPDAGYTFFDIDLDRADLQVVVWEADDAELKLALREGFDLHLFNASSIFNLGLPYDELREEHPRFSDHKHRYKRERHLSKQAVHAINYGVAARKLGTTVGIPLDEARRIIDGWFTSHPGIKHWQERTEADAKSKGYIENKFGARFHILGRLDLPQLLAWTPQSTVAGVINRGLKNIDQRQIEGKHEVQLLIQVHDSLAGQFPTHLTTPSLTAIRDACRIEVPYDDPLIIPTGIKTSQKSWGDC